MSLGATTWQTVGPFYHSWLYVSDLTGPDVSGQRIEIARRVLDADGKGVPDAMLEIWQPTPTENTRTRKISRTRPPNRAS